MPLRSAIASISFAVWLASDGCSTTESWIARSDAKSSSAICDGPSSPIETPACEPDRRRVPRGGAPGWGARKAQARPGDRRHAHEVVRAAEERRERRRERHPVADLEPDRGGDHLLLGDVLLEVALRMRLAEHLRVRRVRDLAVERADVAAHGAERRDRVAVGLAGGDLLAEVPARQLAAVDVELVRLRVALGRRDVDGELAVAPELFDRLVGVLERLAVLAGLVLDRLDALALLGLGDDHGRAALGLAGLRVGRVDRVVVVAVDRDRVPAERLGAANVAVEVPADHGLASLAEPVDVDDRGEVVELVERSVLEGLPHRALGHLGVTAE